MMRSFPVRSVALLAGACGLLAHTATAFLPGRALRSGLSLPRVASTADGEEEATLAERARKAREEVEALEAAIQPLRDAARKEKEAQQEEEDGVALADIPTTPSLDGRRVLVTGANGVCVCVCVCARVCVCVCVSVDPSRHPTTRARGRTHKHAQARASTRKHARACW